MENCTQLNTLIELSRRYWRLRDAGEVGENRSMAHNALLDELHRLGISYQDREDAANIGRLLLQHESLFRRFFELGIKSQTPVRRRQELKKAA